jgi:hypothetical protein
MLQILILNATALLVLNYPDSYVFKSWHGTLFTIAILSLSVTFNTFFAQKLHLVVIALRNSSLLKSCADLLLKEIAVLILHVAGFFCILITLLILAEKAPSQQVWTTFYDPGWGNQGLSCLIGIVASTSCLLGADAAGKPYLHPFVGTMLIELLISTYGRRASRCGLQATSRNAVGHHYQRRHDVCHGRDRHVLHR